MLRRRWWQIALLCGGLMVLLSLSLVAEEEGITAQEVVEGQMWQNGWQRMMSQPRLQIYRYPFLDMVAGFHFDTRGLLKMRLVVTDKPLNHPNAVEAIRLGYILLTLRATQGQDATIEERAYRRALALTSLTQSQLAHRPTVSFTFERLYVKGERQARQQMLEIFLP